MSINEFGFEGHRHDIRQLDLFAAQFCQGSGIFIGDNNTPIFDLGNRWPINLEEIDNGEFGIQRPAHLIHFMVGPVRRGTLQKRKVVRKIKWNSPRGWKKMGKSVLADAKCITNVEVGNVSFHYTTFT